MNVGMRLCVCVCVCVCVYVCVCVCVCVCVSTPRLLITSGKMWCDIDPINKFYGFCMVAVVGIVSGRGTSIHAYHGN